MKGFRGKRRSMLRTAFLIGGLVVLAACGPRTADPPTRVSNRVSLPESIAKTEGPSKIFGDDGIILFGDRDKDLDGSGGGGIGVNSFLWRASLDTISFMPLSSADPFGGVIITEWYTPPESPEERFKLTVYILDTRLRADGVRVALFRQERDAKDEWTDTKASSTARTELEDAILTRARELRISSTVR